MGDWLESIIYPMLQKRQHLPEDELNRSVLMFTVALIAAGVHILFVVFFFMVGSISLMLCHCIGIAVFVVAYFLMGHHQYDIAGLMIAFMILFTSFATIYVIGGNNFSILYQYITLVMMLVVPFSNKAIPRGFVIVLPLIMLLCYFYTLYHTPLYTIGTANNVLAVINLYINAMGTAVLLSLEKLVRGYIDSFRQQRMEMLQHQAYVDPLTMLRNRRFANDYFEKLTMEPPDHPICIAIADLDNFKVVNDNYGHDAGDYTLKQISNLFTANTRKDDLIIRWGGEEFLLILQDTQLEDAWHILEKIRVQVSELELSYEHNQFNITLTMGLTKLEIFDIAASLEECDQKLYNGKNTGKNKVVV